MNREMSVDFTRGIYNTYPKEKTNQVRGRWKTKPRELKDSENKHGYRMDRGFIVSNVVKEEVVFLAT